jgi:hypothetical protein
VHPLKKVKQVIRAVLDSLANLILGTINPSLALAPVNAGDEDRAARMRPSSFGL